MKQNPQRVTPIASALIMLALLLCSYVADYFWRCDYVSTAGPNGEITGIGRGYEYQFEYLLFRPAAWIESKLRGLPVDAYTRTVVI